MVGVVFDWDDPDDAKGNTQKVRSHGGLRPRNSRKSTSLDGGARVAHGRSSGRPLIDGSTVAGRRVIIVFG